MLQRLETNTRYKMEHYKQNLILFFVFRMCLCDIQIGTFNDGIYYDSHVITTYDTMGMKMCGRHCLYQKSCNAINYNRETLVCELLNTTVDDSSHFLPGSRYSAIDTWSLENDPCYPNPCTGKEKCVKTVTSGYFCQSSAAPCDGVVCLNSGTCKNLASSFQCICVTGFMGSLCEQAEDCSSYKELGLGDGLYNIHVSGLGPIYVFCDMSTDGGGWTVFLNRYDGSVDFYNRNWNDYKFGFGILNGEFWLGNEYVYRMTNLNQYLLRVDLENSAGVTAHAQYTTFMLNDESDKYRLTINGYSGTAGDGGAGMSYNNDQVFSTPDQDYTNFCTSDRSASWWFWSCTNAQLTGLWMPGTLSSKSMFWFGMDQSFGLRKATMKIRRK